MKQASKIRQRRCVSAADKVVIRADAPMFQNTIAQFRIAAGIESMGDSSHRLLPNPVPRAFVRDGVAPASGARDAAGGVLPVGNGSSSRDDHNSRSASERGLVR